MLKEQFKMNKYFISPKVSFNYQSSLSLSLAIREENGERGAVLHKFSRLSPFSSRVMNRESLRSFVPRKNQKAGHIGYVKPALVRKKSQVTLFTVTQSLKRVP